MTWENIYLVCFVLGTTFSVVSFVAGSFHLHWPHFHFHAGGGSGGHGGGAGGRDVAGRQGIGRVNIGTVAAFLAWFGGTGYLVTHYYTVWFLVALAMATVSGLAGAAALFFFLAKVLMRQEAAMDPSDYEMVGALGKLSSPIRPAGTGEMIYSRAGARRAVSARSREGLAIPTGTEVVVTHYEFGIAYVRPWDDLARSSEGETERV